jgi:hypothetical protein
VMLRCLIVCLLGHDRFLLTGECRGPQMALQTCSRKENRRVYSGMELLLSGAGGIVLPGGLPAPKCKEAHHEGQAADRKASERNVAPSPRQGRCFGVLSLS